MSNAQRHTHFLDSLALPGLWPVGLRLLRSATPDYLGVPGASPRTGWMPSAPGCASSFLRPSGISQGAEALTAAQAHQPPCQRLGEPPEASPCPLRGPVAPQSITGRLKASTLFLLDEFAALGPLEVVERAMGLMAGYGLQLWPILQDMSQLKDTYGDRAGTFIANAGVQQVFGVNDFETAKWLSQMISQETAGFQTDSFKPGDGPSFSNNLTGRDLLTPDEIMQLPPDRQLLRVQGQATAIAQKLRYYADSEFAGRFTPEAR